MKTIQKLWGGLVHKNAFSKIYSGQVNSQVYKQAIQEYNQSDLDTKATIIEQLMSRLKKMKSIREILASLLLLEYLLIIEPSLNFSVDSVAKPSEPKSDIDLKAKKECAACGNFIEFYFNFLKSISEKSSEELDFNKCSVKEWVDYCWKSVDSILQFLKIDFIAEYCIVHSKYKDIVQMSIRNILQRISFDMKVLNNFLDKWAHLIIEKSKLSFQINDIYEKVFFINKNIKKLQNLSRVLKAEVEFKKYELKRELNEAVEREMKERSEELKNYKSMKFLRNGYQREDEMTRKQERVSAKTVIDGESDGATVIRFNSFY